MATLFIKKFELNITNIEVIKKLDLFFLNEYIDWDFINSEYYYVLGYYYKLIKKFDKCIYLFKLSRHPKCYYYLGSYCLNNKDYDNMLIYYNKAAYKGNLDAIVSLGIYYDTIVKDYKKAMIYYRIAIENGHLNSHILMADILSDINEIETMEDYLQIAINNNHIDSIIYMSLHYYKEGDFMNMNRCCDIGCKLDNFHCYILKGVYYKNIHDFENMIKNYIIAFSLIDKCITDDIISLFVDDLDYTFITENYNDNIMKRAVAYYYIYIGKIEKAIDFLKESYEYKNDDIATLLELIKYCDDNIMYINKLVELNETMAFTYLSKNKYIFELNDAFKPINITKI